MLVIILAKLRWTRHDLVAAYDEAGDFEQAAYLLDISSREFNKLWRDLVGASPQRSATKIRKVKKLADETVHKIALFSDPHFGSRYQCLEELHDFTKLAQKRDVKTLICLGDLSDGLKMHQDMEAEQFLHKPRDILNYITDNYPKGFKTNLFITGNHDYSLEKAGCMNLGEKVAEQRQDLIFVGHDSGSVTVNGGLNVYLHHGTGGCAEVRSKRQQDMAAGVVSATRGKVPHLLLTGHCHAENVIPQYLGMMCISLGCFQRQTPYLLSRGLYPDVGGMILTYQVINGKLTNPGIDFISYDV